MNLNERRRLWSEVKKGKVWLLPIIVLSVFKIPERIIRSKERKNRLEEIDRFKTQQQMNRKNRNEGGDIYPMW